MPLFALAIVGALQSAEDLKKTQSEISEEELEDRTGAIYALLLVGCQITFLTHQI